MSKTLLAYRCVRMRRVLRDSECGCSRPDHSSADECAGRCSPCGRCEWVGRAHSGGPRSAAADAAMAVPRSLVWQAADRRRRTARAGSALSAAVNVTYTAAAEGLVAWLNNQTARYASSTVHVVLPSGNVARGNVSLRFPSGLNLILEGQGMAGASNTTLDLERQNLDVGGMLGDGGRIEFRNMRVRNVRPSPCPCRCARAPDDAVAGLCRAMRCASLGRRRPMRAPAVLCCPPIGGVCCVLHAP